MVRGFLLVAMIILGDVGNSSSTVQAPKSQDTLSIGPVALQLGMGQDDVAARFRRAGYTLTQNETGFAIVDHNPVTNEPKMIGILSFKEKRLRFINKDWAPGDTDAASIAEGLYGALSNTYQEGRSLCRLQTAVQQNPSAEIKSVLLSCGQSQRVIELIKSRYQGVDFVSVSEILQAE